MANYPTQSAIAAILKSIGEKKKKRAMESTLDRAKAKGYDIEVTIDPQTQKAAYKLNYKGKSQSDMVEDKFKVEKMLAEIQKWQREAKGATQAGEFQETAELGFGGGAQALARAGISGQYKDKIKEALRMKSQYRQAGKTLLPGAKGYEQVALPKKRPTYDRAKTEIATNKFIESSKTEGILEVSKHLMSNRKVYEEAGVDVGGVMKAILSSKDVKPKDKFSLMNWLKEVGGKAAGALSKF